MTPMERILALDMNNLSQEDIDFLHTLKNKATAMQGRLQLKDLMATDPAYKPDKPG